MKKRIFCFVIAACLLLGCLVSCGQTQHDKEQSPSEDKAQNDLPAPTPDPALPNDPKPEPEPEPKPEPEPEPQPEPIFHKGTSSVIYGNIYYYTDQTAHTLYQKDLTNPDDTGKPLWQGKGEDPFGGLGQSYLMMVDEIESEKEGAPVLVISKSDLASQRFFIIIPQKEV